MKATSDVRPRTICSWILDGVESLENVWFLVVGMEIEYHERFQGREDDPDSCLRGTDDERLDHIPYEVEELFEVDFATNSHRSVDDKT